MGRIAHFLSRKTSGFHARYADWAGAAPVSGVISTIAPGDGMYQGDNGSYFRVGYSALRCVRLALLTAEKDGVESILDMACGHGRVLRMLKAAFPRARLTACDINRGGVDFCADRFDATPVYSAERPDQIHLPGRYDLIWCGSLFTHFDEDRWPGFLDLMQGHLNPGGILVLTTHGRWVARRLRGGDCTYGLDPDPIARLLENFEAGGFGFARQVAPGVGDWGISISQPSWVLSHLEKSQALDLLFYGERAWDHHQDVVALRRSP